jgi:hypothetical protein
MWEGVVKDSEEDSWFSGFLNLYNNLYNEDSAYGDRDLSEDRDFCDIDFYTLFVTGVSLIILGGVVEGIGSLGWHDNG